MTERNPYFDFLRGFAIIMVVGIHTMTNHSPSFESLEEACTILLRLMLNCAVPLFLAISGYFMASKKLSWGKEHLMFLKRQIPKVYVPCLIFSLPYLAMSIVAGENGFLKPLVVFFACGFSVYYFIALIIQYYILLPTLVKFNNFFGWGGAILTFAISTISIIIVSYVTKCEGVQLPLLVYAAPFPLWILFFFLGVYFSEHKRDYNIAAPLALTVVGLLLQIIEYKLWLDNGKVALGIKLSSFVFSAGVIWLFFSSKLENGYRESMVMKFVNWIGGISFGVYLLHCYVIIAINKLLPQIGWLEKWTLVLCVTILLIWVAKALFPRFSVKYLGFR